MSNVVNKCTCLRDANMPYIDVTSRHLVTGVQERLHSAISKTAITRHINSSTSCNSSTPGVDSFKTIRQCNNDHKAKVEEALLIKKLKPKLNIIFVC